MSKLIFPVAVWGVVAVSAQVGTSCDSNLEEEDETSSLLQVGGNSRGISSRSAPAGENIGCPNCKGCLDEKACRAGLTVQEYCKKHPNTRGCDVATDDETKDCCRDFGKVDCAACQNKVTVEEECMQNTQRWSHSYECFSFYEPYCEDFLEELEKNDIEFEGFPQSHKVCDAVVPKPYTGPPLKVNLNKKTCKRHYGKEFYWIPFHDPPSSIEESMKTCIEFGSDCSGITCEEAGDSVGCTTRRGSDLHTAGDQVFDGLYWHYEPESVKEKAESVFSLRKSDCTKKKRKMKKGKGTKK